MAGEPIAIIQIALPECRPAARNSQADAGCPRQQPSSVPASLARQGSQHGLCDCDCGHSGSSSRRAGLSLSGRGVWARRSGADLDTLAETHLRVVRLSSSSSASRSLERAGYHELAAAAAARIDGSGRARAAWHRVNMPPSGSGGVGTPVVREQPQQCHTLQQKQWHASNRRRPRGGRSRLLLVFFAFAVSDAGAEIVPQSSRPSGSCGAAHGGALSRSATVDRPALPLSRTSRPSRRFVSALRRDRMIPPDVRRASVRPRQEFSSACANRGRRHRQHLRAAGSRCWHLPSSCSPWAGSS